MIGMLTVILSTTALIMCGYLAVGISGYVAYPLDINSNALKSFPTHDLLMQVGSTASITGCLVYTYLRQEGLTIGATVQPFLTFSLLQAFLTNDASCKASFLVDISC